MPFSLTAPAPAKTINDATVAAKPKSKLFHTTNAEATPGINNCHLGAFPLSTLSATMIVIAPTIIPPKTRRAGPESNVLAGPIKLMRFQPGVGVQKERIANNKSGHGSSGHARRESQVISPMQAKPKAVSNKTKKLVPLMAPIDTKIGFTSQPSKKVYCGTKL